MFSSWVEQRYVGAEGAEFALSGLERTLVAGPRAVWFFVSQLLWPFDLNFIYPRWRVDVASGWQWLFPLGVLTLAAALWGLRRRFRAPLAVLLFLVRSIFPVLGFVNLYGACYSFVWDHWQYLPDLGPLALAAAGLARLRDRLAPPLRGVGPALVAALVALLGAVRWKHSEMFHDNETLYRMTLVRNPGCWLAHNNLAIMLADRPGREPGALAHYEQALRINLGLAEVHYDLAIQLSILPGREAEAMAHYQEALWLRPDYAEAHNNLAIIYARQGRLEEARKHRENALELDPNYEDARRNLSLLQRLQGHCREDLFTPAGDRTKSELIWLRRDR